MLTVTFSCCCCCCRCCSCAPPCLLVTIQITDWIGDLDLGPGWHAALWWEYHGTQRDATGCKQGLYSKGVVPLQFLFLVNEIVFWIGTNARECTWQCMPSEKAGTSEGWGASTRGNGQRAALIDQSRAAQAHNYFGSLYLPPCIACKGIRKERAAKGSTVQATGALLILSVCVRLLPSAIWPV